MNDSMQALTEEVLHFRDARDWKQFHSPQNLAAALAIETGELQETMLWKTDAEVVAELKNPELRDRVSHEIADVFIYALLIADAVGIDPAVAIRAKLRRNEANYPVDKAKGRATKHTEL